MLFRETKTTTFICQGCSKMHSVIYGRSIICGCGVKSSASIEPIKTISGKTTQSASAALALEGGR